jgi:hypothetical protein
MTFNLAGIPGQALVLVNKESGPAQARNATLLLAVRANGYWFSLSNPISRSSLRASSISREAFRLHVITFLRQKRHELDFAEPFGTINLFTPAKFSLSAARLPWSGQARKHGRADESFLLSVSRVKHAQRRFPLPSPIPLFALSTKNRTLGAPPGTNCVRPVTSEWTFPAPPQRK